MSFVCSLFGIEFQKLGQLCERLLRMRGAPYGAGRRFNAHGLELLYFTHIDCTVSL